MGNPLGAPVNAPAGIPAVANFGFEVPALGSGYQYNPSVPGNGFASISGVAGNGSAFNFAPAPQGTQAGFLQSYSGGAGTITMDVGNLVPGQS